MSNLLPEHPPLTEFLAGIHHLFIDIARLKPEPDYEEKRGGYCDLQVARLDHDITGASKLVAAKKLLLGTRSNDPKRLAFRLARELKVWAGLSHPHVLPLLGFYVSDNYKTAVLISEYMVHGDLKDYITRTEPSYDERLRLIRDLTDGLAYLHTQIAPVRHGDLKPGNVFVNLQRRALLADFGLSKALNTNPTGFTTGNDARGTVRFSSPEILLQGVAAQSLSNDIWSWGCLVLEAMSDKAPFADILPEPQLILAIAQGQTPCDTENLATELPQFKDLLARCWSIHTNQRPTAMDCLDVVQYMLFSSAPAAITRAAVETLEYERLDPLTNGSAAQQQQLRRHPPGKLQTQALSVVTQHSQALVELLPSSQRYQPGPFTLPFGFHAFFMSAFSAWLTQRQRTLESPQINEKEVELPNLFLIVGALGGWRDVSEKMLWQVVGEEIGLLSLVGPMPPSKPEVAEQLSKIYGNILAAFEAHWHTMLSPRDPNSIFPLPPQLQHLHPEIERLATTLLLWRQQQERFPRLVEVEPQQPVDRNAMDTQRPGLGVGVSNGQVGPQSFTGPPLDFAAGPTTTSPHPSPYTSRMGPPDGLRNYSYSREQRQPPQQEQGPTNTPTFGGNRIAKGIGQNQGPIQPVRQVVTADYPGHRPGTLMDQVEWGSRPGVCDRSRRTEGITTPPGAPARLAVVPHRFGGQGSEFTAAMAGPSSESPGPIHPQILIQAMRTIGLADGTHESLSPEEWDNIHIFLRAVMHPQRHLGIETPRMTSGGNPRISGASQSGPSGPKGRLPGPNFPEQHHIPTPQEIMGLSACGVMKRPRSPSVGEDMFTEESLLVRKRLRKDHQNSSGPVPSFTQGPNGATYPGTIRAPSPGNARQAMNPIIVNEGSHYPVRLPIQGALQPGSQRSTLPMQNNLSGLVFNSYTDGLPIPITDLETWASNSIR